MCNYNSAVLVDTAKDYGLAAPMGTIMEDGWVDDGRPAECMHAGICVRRVGRSRNRSL